VNWGSELISIDTDATGNNSTRVNTGFMNNRKRSIKPHIPQINVRKFASNSLSVASASATAENMSITPRGRNDPDAFLRRQIKELSEGNQALVQINSARHIEAKTAAPGG
jgi:hypothetical protein